MIWIQTFWLSKPPRQFLLYPWDITREYKGQNGNHCKGKSKCQGSAQLGFILKTQVVIYYFIYIINSFIYSFSKHLLNSHHISGFAVDAGDMNMNKSQSLTQRGTQGGNRRNMVLHQQKNSSPGFNIQIASALGKSFNPSQPQVPDQSYLDNNNSYLQDYWDNLPIICRTTCG